MLVDIFQYLIVLRTCSVTRASCYTEFPKRPLAQLNKGSPAALAIHGTNQVEIRDTLPSCKPCKYDGNCLHISFT
jgi:hypothetical protein